MIKNPEIDIYTYKTKDRIEILCDYCEREYTLTRDKYFKNHKKFHTDACSGCKPVRIKEINKAKRESGEVVKKSNVSYEEIKQRFIDLNVVPLFENTPDLLATRQKLPFICPKHEDRGIQYREPWVRKHLSSLCVYCNREEKALARVIPIETINNILESKNAIMLKSEYSGGKSKINFMCLKHEDKGIQTILAQRHRDGEFVEIE